MKKNFAMRIAACLLMVTMLSLCMVSYTYAKYTTSDNHEDSATVAKWGITLSVVGDETLYHEDKSTDDVAGKKVTANTLAAPGTYQKLAIATLTGTPDVAYEIIVDVNLDLGANWIVDGAVYCPLVFTVDGTSYKIDATYTTTALLEEAVEKAVKEAITGENVSSKQYDAGVPVPSSVADGVLIDWTWAFVGDDAKDTALGNAANKATVTFSLEVTVNQVN